MFFMKLVKDLRPTKKAVTTAWAEPGAHFNIRYYGATEDVEALSGDIVNGAIAFRSEEFTKGQLVALKHLATPGLLSPRVGQETILRLGQISWFPIEMTVLTGAPALAIPTADFEPNDMHVALSRLALTRFEYDQQIQGFTMAVTLLCQKKRGYKAREIGRRRAVEADKGRGLVADDDGMVEDLVSTPKVVYERCTTEMSNIMRIYNPMDSNLLWRILNIIKPSEEHQKAARRPRGWRPSVLTASLSLRSRWDLPSPLVWGWPSTI